jgi:flagellar biosynthetic protein FliP
MKKLLNVKWIYGIGIFLFIIPLINAQTPFPKVTIGLEEATSSSDFVLTIQILFMMTVLTLAPSILIMMTSFTRLIIVFHFLRTALATQTVPSNQILIGLALFITAFVMKPVYSEINEAAIQPYLQDKINQTEAIDAAVKPLKTFMLKQTREVDLQLFVDMRHETRPATPDDIPVFTVIPAFIISEIKTAFQIGFLLYLPMLAVDLIVASVLLSMGMMMLPPIMISMPFKLLLFVLVDGWNLVIESLVKGYM